MRMHEYWLMRIRQRNYESARTYVLSLGLVFCELGRKYDFFPPFDILDSAIHGLGRSSRPAFLTHRCRRRAMLLNEGKETCLSFLSNEVTRTRTDILETNNWFHEARALQNCQFFIKRDNSIHKLSTHHTLYSFLIF